MSLEERKKMIREKQLAFETHLEEAIENRFKIRSEWFGLLGSYGFGFREFITAYSLSLQYLERCETSEYIARLSEDSAHDCAYSRLCKAYDLFFSFDNVLCCICSEFDGIGEL